MRLLAGLLALCLASVPARAQAHHGGGVPERVVADVRTGPWDASLWASPAVGTGMLYVVLDAPAGSAFVAPTSVRVAVAPASGSETVYDAHVEPVAHGARFVAHVPFDHSDDWRVRVLAAGPAGAGELRATVHVPPPARLGAFDLLLYALPVLLVGGLWLRAAAARRPLVRQPALAAR